MSIDLQGSDKPGYVIVETTGQVVELEFSDGKHYLNRALVAHLGGPEEVRKYTVEARQITHAEFIKRFWGQVQKEAINKTVNNMVANHFAGRRII